MKYFYSRVLSFVVTFSLVFSAVPAPVSAQTVEELSALIAQLQAQLQTLQTTSSGTTTVAPTTSSLTYGCVDLRSYPSMSQGASDATTNGGVSLLQGFLARDTEIYPEGVKSGYFWSLTKLAVQRFQTKYGVAVLGMPGYGYVGPITKNKIYSLSCFSDVSVPGTGTTDTTKPEVTIAEPTAQSTVPNTGFTISGSVTDLMGGADIAAVAVKIVDQRADTNLIRNATINTSLNYPKNGHPWSLKVLETWINPGATLTLIVSATDKSGNQSSVVQRVVTVSSGAVLDFAAPSVSIASPAVGATVSYADGFLAQGSAADGIDGVGVARVEVKVTDSSTGVSRTENAVLTAEDTLTKKVAWKFPVPSTWITPTKSATLSVIAKDYNGHTSPAVTRTIAVSAATSTISLDYTAPTVTITIPSLSTSVTQVSANGFYVNGTAKDNDGGVGVAKVEVSVYDLARPATAPAWISATLQGADWAYLVPATAITAGAKVKVSARAIDQRGNVSLEKSIEATVAGQTATQPNIFALYDMNKDGLINATDVQYVTDVAAKTKTCPTGMDCDLNNDGVANATDASLFLAAVRAVYDFNNDGVLNGSDVQIVADVGVGTRSCPASKTCDFNRDGTVSATDATMVQNAINTLNATVSTNSGFSNVKLDKVSYVAGSIAQITWDATSDLAAQVPAVDVLSSDRAKFIAELLSQNTKGPGWLTWNIPKEFSPGNYVIRVTVDRSGIQEGFSAIFTITAPAVTDTTVPSTVAVIDPIENQVVTYSQGFAMQVRAIDNTGGSGIKSVRASVLNTSTSAGDQYAMSLTGNNIWSVQIPQTKLTYGATLQLAAEAFDNAGNSKISATRTVKVEAAPITTTSYPACGDSKDNDNDGKIDMEDWGCRNTTDTSESNRTPVPTNFKVGDVIVTTGNPNTRDIPAGSSLGTKSIGNVGTIIAGPKDAALNGTSYWWWKVDFVEGSDGWVTDEWIKLKTTTTVTNTDTTKPTVVITDPKAVYPYPAYYANNFTVKGTAADTGGSGLSKVLVSIYNYSNSELTVNEAVATLSAGAWSYKVPATAVTVANKVHILAVAVDGSGNRSNTYEAQANILVDTTGKSPVWIYDLTGDNIANKADIDFLNNVLLGSATCPAGKSCDFTGDFVQTLADKTRLTQLIRAMYDLNVDGALTSADAQIVLDVSAGLRTCPTGKTCDFNQSGGVNATDANILNSAISTLPVAQADDDAAALAALLASAQALLAQLMALMGQ